MKDFLSKWLQRFDPLKWDSFDQFLDNIERFVVVSNNGDVCVRIRLKKGYDKDGLPVPDATFYYF